MAGSGPWQNRTAEDLCREALIYMEGILLFWRGFKLRCHITMFIAVFITLQHSAILFFGMDLLSRSMVLVGSVVLAITGYYRLCPIISFAGTYSFTSKYNLCSWILKQCTSDTVVELFKLLISVVVWLIAHGAIQVMRLRRFVPFPIIQNFEEMEPLQADTRLVVISDLDDGELDTKI